MTLVALDLGAAPDWASAMCVPVSVIVQLAAARRRQQEAARQAITNQSGIGTREEFEVRSFEDLRAIGARLGG